MDLAAFKAKLKSDNLAGWYIISGEEDYLKKYYMNSLRSLITAEDDPFMPFNYAVYDGADIDFGAVSEAIKSPPMMSEYKLIEWRYANLDELKEGEIKALEALFELKNEYSYAIFSILANSDGFDTGTPKKPTKLYKRLSSGFDIIDFPKSTDSQLLSWLKKHFDAEGIGVDVKTLNSLIFRSGRSMEVLNNEVIKLASYAKAKGKSQIFSEDVDSIASSTVECDAFALSNAVLDKNVEGAFAALLDLKQRRIEPQVVIAMLERTYSDLASVAFLLDEGAGAPIIESVLKFHPFKAKLYINAAKKVGSKALAEALSELCRIDASSKSGGMSGYGVIEMFITERL